MPLLLLAHVALPHGRQAAFVVLLQRVPAIVAAEHSWQILGC